MIKAYSMSLYNKDRMCESSLQETIVLSVFGKTDNYVNLIYMHWRSYTYNSHNILNQ